MTPENKAESSFKGIFKPAELLKLKNISPAEKDIVADIAYFDGRDGYYFKNPAIAKKFGISRMTVIRAIERLCSPKLGMIKKTGDDFHRRLWLSEDAANLFNAKDIPPKQTNIFKKPTAQEVTEYAQSIDYQLDGENFVSHYEAKGWKIGKTPMRNWKAAVVTWKKRNNNNGSSEIIRSNQPAEPYIR